MYCRPVEAGQDKNKEDIPVNADREIVVVSRTKGKNVVVMDLEEYNAIQETLHLTSSVKNRQRLAESIQEMNDGSFKAHKLIEK